jgi:uncharacterized protein
MSETINNASQREEALKEIIRALHAGKSVDEVKAAFAELLEDVGPDEIVRIEEALVQEGLDPAEIQPLCDVHVAVFQDSLDAQKAPETVPGHPIFTYRAENLGVRRVLDEVAAALEDYQQQPNPQTRQAAQAAVAKLQVYDKHYLRKENLLFAYLEHTGFTGPSKVMWGVHNDIRDMWKALAQTLEAGIEDPAALAATIDAQFPPLAQAIRDMIYKEEHILFPAALARLSDEDWAAIRHQGEEIGYAYARPGRAWTPATDPEAERDGTRSPDEAVRRGAVPPDTQRVGELISLNTGPLTAAQIDGMLQALPIDITFVDEYDEVRYFSQGQERIFQRSPAIIGRKVENCHPPQSVDKVRRILDDFKAGVRDVAAFWIQMQGMFVHIRYFAIRDENGTYRGTIEVTQNLTPLRALEGERRLLDD